MTIEQDVTTLIEDASLATFGTNYFIGTRPYIPSGDGPFVAVAMTPGSAPGYIQDESTPPYRHPGAAVTVVAASAIASKALAMSLFSLFAAVTNTVINTTFYLRIRPTQEPFELPLDPAKNRTRYRFNVLFEYDSRQLETSTWAQDNFIDGAL